MCNFAQQINKFAPKGYKCILVDTNLLNKKYTISLINDMSLIIFKTRDDLVKIDLDKMVYAEADGNYLYIYMQNGLRVMVTMSLIQFEKLIESMVTDANRGMYIRIGRKYIVDRRYIVQISLPKQLLILSNMATDKPVSLSVPKDALKLLKQKMTE